MEKELRLFEELLEVVVLLEKQTKEILYQNHMARVVLTKEKDYQALFDIASSDEEKKLVEINDILYSFICHQEDSKKGRVLLIGKQYGIPNNNYAFLDRLTRLPIAEYFYNLAEERLKNQDNHKNLVFVYFNVDNFKTFNSEYGYKEGDRFLCALARLITDTFCDGLVGRTSDDHFIVLADKEELLEKIQKIHETAHTMQKDVKMEVKAGIYEYETGISATRAHDRAKTACDETRNKYNQNYCYYDEKLRKKLLREKYIIDNIDLAIEREYLMVYYQPIRRVFTDKVCAMESLVRWNDPELGFLSPGEFIPLLEKRHLIHKVDTYVLDKVCREIIVSRHLGEAVVPISINLSRLDFQLMDVYEMVKKTTEKYQISPEMIHVEITESALNDDEEKLIATMEKLHQDGFEIWLDDFGSKYSTLNTLQNYKFDLLKIDMDFFRKFDTNENARTIIATITDMAKRLHMRVLAEGIETKEQYEFLKQVGCDKAQGFFFAKPAPIDTFYGRNIPVEGREESKYYTTIGRVNFLSPNPLEDYKDKGQKKLYNVIPTAIVQYTNDWFSYLYLNEGFKECLKSMEVPSEEESEHFINDDLTKLKTRLREIAQKSHTSQRLESLDFIFKGYRINIRVKEIAFQNSSQALFVTMMNLSSIENVRKMEQLETSLNFLYSIYERVDMIDIEKNHVENVYLGSQYYRTIFKDKDLRQSVIDYANTDIAIEDREKFLKFYDIDTLEERIEKSGKDYMIQPLRTMTQKDGIHLQSYVIIRINDGKSVRYLSCVRDIDSVENEEFEEAIRTNSKHTSYTYQLALDELQAAIFEWDIKKKEAHVTRRGYQYLFCHDTLDDILQNKGNLDSIYPEDIPCAMRFFADSKLGKSRAETTLRLKMMDGSYRWSRMTGIFEYDENENLEYVMGIILDVEKEQVTLEQAKFLNQMPTALGIFEVQDEVVRQLFMNDEYFRLVEDTREDRGRYNQSFLDGIHPEDRKYVMSAMKSVIDGKDECSEVCRVITGTGEYKWIRFTSSVAKRENNYLLVYSTYVNTEDIIQSPAIAIQSGDELFQLICNELKAAVFEMNFETETVSFSKSCEVYALYHQKEREIFENKLDRNIVHPDDFSTCMEFFSQLKLGGNHSQVTCRFLMTNGSYRWVNLIGKMYRDSQNNSVSAIGIIVDVDKEIRRKKENESLLNDIPGGVGIFDIKDGIATQRYMNDAYYRMVSDERAQRNLRNNNSFFNGVAKEDWPVVANAIRSIMEGKNHVDFSYRANLHDGSTIWLRLEGNVVSREERHIVIYCSFSNVTEMYKKLEDQLRLTSEALEEAKKANEERAEFYSRMSHDMRTPMNGILGMAALSKEEQDTEKLHYNIEMIEASGTYMLSLINDSLDMQRIENGNLVLMPQIFQSEMFVENIQSMITPTARQKGVNFYVINKNINLNSFVRIDGVRFKQIFMNLISNAIKFTPAGGTVEVSMECIEHQKNKDVDIFKIVDNGVGMSKEYLQESIFLAYKQEANEMTAQYAGSGLGLAITKSLVELMGGTIEVESELGKGTTFTLTFCIELVEENEVKDIRKEESHTAKKEAILEGKRILLFEDHPLNAEIARRLLEKKKLIVEHAKNGREGLKMFSHSDIGYYDAILMDIRMPVMDGLTAAKAIRSLKRTDAATIPIVAMTANAYPEDIQSTKEAGMNVHLSKPIQAQKLYSTLEKLLK